MAEGCYTPVNPSRPKRKDISPIAEDLTPVHKATKMSKLSDDDIVKIGDYLEGKIKATMMRELKISIHDEVQTAVTAALQTIKNDFNAKMESIVEENTSLKTKISTLEVKMAHIEQNVDDEEQYSRRNNLRISGVPISDSKAGTDNIIIEKAKEIGVELNTCDIDRSHLVGTNGDILVKFVSYRKRRQLYDNRKKLGGGLFISEDLTKKRQALLYEARTLRRAGKISHAFSSDGTILIYDGRTRIRIRHSQQLVPFAERIVPGQPDTMDTGIPSQPAAEIPSQPAAEIPSQPDAEKTPPPVTI